MEMVTQGPWLHGPGSVGREERKGGRRERPGQRTWKGRSAGKEGRRETASETRRPESPLGCAPAAPRENARPSFQNWDVLWRRVWWSEVDPPAVHLRRPCLGLALATGSGHHTSGLRRLLPCAKWSRLQRAGRLLRGWSGWPRTIGGDRQSAQGSQSGDGCPLRAPPGHPHHPSTLASARAHTSTATGTASGAVRLVPLEAQE